MLALAPLAAPAAAQTPVPAASAPAEQPALDAAAVMQKMLERNAGLRTYRTRVGVKARMLNFPFLTQRLDGTSYFSAPDRYEVVFDRVPGYAKSFSRVFDDVGDPARWAKEQIVTLDAPQMFDGRPALVLRLIKRIHSAQIDHALAVIDPKSFALLQMQWYYTNGGTISMTQSYRNENGYEVLASQHAVIRIPYIHAVADATYGPYETNLAIDVPPAPER